MKIYTKTGDKGTTQIYADKVVRMPKDDAVLECYGTLDELNAHIGLLLSYLPEDDTRAFLAAQQKLIFHIGFAISATSELKDEHVTALENTIDALQAGLPAQTSFILPGGITSAAQAHVCRTVCRRAERRLVSVSEQHEVNELCLRYLNRLSDFLFALARTLNFQADSPDIPL